MPQMSPMNWLLLNFYFIMIITIFITIIHFNKIPKQNKYFTKSLNMFKLKW